MTWAANTAATCSRARATRTVFTDAFGQTHARAPDGARIVSLVPSITELLFALELDAAIVGRTGFCIHPRQGVRAVPKLGGTKDVDMDALRARNPSHVIVNIDENTRPVFDELRRHVPNVIVTHPNEPRDNLDLFDLLGGIFSREHQAAGLREQFLTRLEKLQRATDSRPPKKVLYLIWREPWMSVREDTYIARTLALLNWQVVTAGAASRYPTLEHSDIRDSGAELVLLSSEPYPFRDKHIAEVRSLCPPQTGVLLVDGEMFSWYGSRAIAGLDYLEELGRCHDDRAA